MNLDDWNAGTLPETDPWAVEALKRGLIRPRAEAVPQARQKTWGLRNDGTPKGEGWLGVQQRPDGKVSTEISVGVNINGKETEIPTMVPTLSQEEIQYLLQSPMGPQLWGTPVGKSIMQKAVDHATEQMKQGRSPFKGVEIPKQTQ